MIKCVIFDLDGTLCDYDAARQRAMKEVDKILEFHKLDSKQYWLEYKENEKNLYPKFLSGEISIGEYRLFRFLNILEGKIEDAASVAREINYVFMENANKKIELYSDVLSVLVSLKEKGHIIVILTNGPHDGQMDKFKALLLETIIFKMYSSDGVGHAKPKPESFQFVLDDLGLDTSKVMMVGDSIENDYIGAENIGIKSILIDRGKRHPDFKGNRITKMDELLKFL